MSTFNGCLVYCYLLYVIIQDSIIQIQMEPQNQQQPCSNCGSNFPTDKIDLHQAFCIRNMRKCPQCSIFVDIRQTQQHQISHHQKEPCAFCKTEFTPDELKEHAGSCNRRPKNCQYCETDIPFEEFNKHEGVCGSRTKPCEICRANVILRDHVNHEIRCRERPPEPAVQPPPVPRQQRAAHDRPVLQHMPSTRERGEVRHDRPGRDVSTNMLRHADTLNHQNGGDRSLSSNRLNDKGIPKKPSKCYNGVIPAEPVKKVVDILPISVKLTIKNRDQGREPLKNRN